MSKLVVKGGLPLNGEVELRGAKNAVPKHLVAALLTRDPCTVDNVPKIDDVHLMGELLGELEADVSVHGSAIDVLTADIKPLPDRTLYRFSGRSRIPILMAGPLLHRFGEAFIPTLGGCRIGKRPVDYHVQALRELGATATDQSEGIRLTAKRLQGTRISLPYPSVGATEQILLAAVLAEGLTEISNAAMEPEVVDLIAVLQKMGAIISVKPDRVVEIHGVETLQGFHHRAIPDRLEAASWACAVAATSGRIFIRDARQLDMMTFLNVYRTIGGNFSIYEEGIEFSMDDRPKPAPLETDVHPGFMTDWQPPLGVALTQAEGVSIIHETVYEDRLGYLRNLETMGAKVQLYRDCLGGSACRFGRMNFLHSAVIPGPSKLQAGSIKIPDLRGGFSHVIAALVAEGLSTIENTALLERGYETFVAKLEGVGAHVEHSE